LSKLKVDFLTAGEFFAEVEGRCSFVVDFLSSRFEELLIVLRIADLVRSPKLIPKVLLLGVIANLECEMYDISESDDPQCELFPYSSPSIAL
jgi:hypothetical protein